MSHTTRSPFRTGIARTLRYAPRNARSDLGRHTARRVRRATSQVLSRLTSGRLDADAATWPRARDVTDPWGFD